MKYYSEVTKKFYNSEDEAVNAEKEREAIVKAEQEKKDALAKERKSRADELTQAMKDVQEAKKRYDKLLREFCRDYGIFHFSWTESTPLSMFDFFNII